MYISFSIDELSAYCYKTHYADRKTTPHPVTRCGDQETYKQVFVAQIEVKCSRRHLASVINILVAMDTIVITLQGSGPSAPRLLHGIISKCWLCTRVRHVWLHAHGRLYRYIDT